jgi:hypothetical protein
MVLRTFIPLLLVFFCFASVVQGQKIKTISLSIDELGMVSDGRDTIGSEELAGYVRQRLFNHYKGTDKMYDRIEVSRINGGPTPELWDILIKEVSLGQKQALADVCMFKYKKGFDSLTGSQQEKIRKKFPVLFQGEYTF